MPANIRFFGGGFAAAPFLRNIMRCPVFETLGVGNPILGPGPPRKCPDCIVATWLLLEWQTVCDSCKTLCCRTE